MLITPGKVIDKFLEKLAYAYKWDYVEKPASWALYETWKWVDKNESPKKKDKKND